jgi:hypothetical protein
VSSFGFAMGLGFDRAVSSSEVRWGGLIEVAAVVLEMVLFRIERLDDTREDSVSVDVDTDSETTGSILENGSSRCGVDECGGRCTSMSIVWGCGTAGLNANRIQRRFQRPSCGIESLRALYISIVAFRRA